MINWRPIPKTIAEPKEIINFGKGKELSIPTKLLDNPNFKEYTILWKTYHEASYSLACLSYEINDLAVYLFHDIYQLTDEERAEKQKTFDDCNLKYDSSSKELDSVIPKLKELFLSFNDEEKSFAMNYMHVSF